MNYDFLTVEDYNTIVLNYADGFREDYLLSFSDLTGLSEGFYTIDGFIKVTVNNNGVFLEILNTCFTGSFCLLDADNSSYNILDYDADKHSLSLKLNMDDGDVVDGKLLLHLANTPYFAINENPYIIENLNPFIFTLDNVSALDIIVKDKDGNNVNGNAVLKAFVDTSTVTYPIVDGKCRIYTNFWAENSFELIIGDYHTVFTAKWIKQTPSININSESKLYQGVKKAQLIVSSNIRNVPVTIEYNDKKIEGVFDNATTSFYLDLENHFEDTLDLHFIFNDTKTMKGGEFNFTVETNRLAGSLYDLKTEYGVLEPTVYDLNVNNEGDVIVNDVVINYVREDRCNSRIAVTANNVTFNNFKYGDCQIVCGLKDSIITLNNCEIRRLDNIKSKLIVNDSSIHISNYMYSPINNAEFNNCSFIKISSYVTPILKIVDNGEVLFNNCNFILKYSMPNVSFGVKNSIMNISINAKVNNVPATQLKNNKFPMLNNKSEIDLELKDCNVTSDNGMIWTVSDSNTIYMENVKIEEV